jgi:hypothetical protein
LSCGEVDSRRAGRKYIPHDRMDCEAYPMKEAQGCKFADALEVAGSSQCRSGGRWPEQTARSSRGRCGSTLRDGPMSAEIGTGGEARASENFPFRRTGRVRRQGRAPWRACSEGLEGAGAVQAWGTPRGGRERAGSCPKMPESSGGHRFSGRWASLDGLDRKGIARGSSIGKHRGI